MIRLRVTDTQIDYEGSITIGRKLLNGLLDGEKVTIHCLNGEQFDTYVIAGDKGLVLRAAETIRNYDVSHGHATEDCSFLSYMEVAIQILDLCEEGVCVNGAAASKVQIGDIIEVTNKEGL